MSPPGNLPPVGPVEPFAELPTAEFALPGPLRDRLVTAILDGRKVSTASLFAAYEREGVSPPVAGQRSLVVDSDGRGVAVIELTNVTVVPLGDVDIAHVVGEGEGHESVASWRADHERFWRDPDIGEELAGSPIPLNDGTLVVLEKFHVVERLDAHAPVLLQAFQSGSGARVCAGEQGDPSLQLVKPCRAVRAPKG